MNPDSFQYAYETSNGIKAQSAGQLKQIGEESGIIAQGDYSYRAPDGQEIKVSYIADENGFQASIFLKKTIHNDRIRLHKYNSFIKFTFLFQPTGDHIPQPPPIPEAIRRALEYLAEHAPPQKQ